MDIYIRAKISTDEFESEEFEIGDTFFITLEPVSTKKVIKIQSEFEVKYLDHPSNSITIKRNLNNALQSKS